MKFCSACGEAVSKKIPEGDNKQRYVCDACDTIHYQNPRNIVGTVPMLEDKVLLCRRAIEPRKGFWTLPAGFMENGESTLEGALRETWEEARAKISDHAIYRIFDLPYIDQVYIFYRGELTDEGFGVGPESLEVKLFSEDEIPWDEIAFQVVRETLREVFADKKTGEFRVKALEHKSYSRLK